MDAMPDSERLETRATGTTSGTADSDEPTFVTLLPNELKHAIYKLALFDDVQDGQPQFAVGGVLPTNTAKLQKLKFSGLIGVSKEVRGDALRFVLGYYPITRYVDPFDIKSAEDARDWMIAAFRDAGYVRHPGPKIKELRLHLTDACWATLHNFHPIIEMVQEIGLKPTVMAITPRQSRQLPSLDKGICVMIKAGVHVHKAYNDLIDLGIEAHRNAWSKKELLDAVSIKVQELHSKGPGKLAMKKMREKGLTLETVQRPAAAARTTDIQASTLHMVPSSTRWASRKIRSQAYWAGYPVSGNFMEQASAQAVHMPNTQLQQLQVHSLAFLLLTTGSVVPVSLVGTSANKMSFTRNGKSKRFFLDRLAVMPIAPPLPPPPPPPCHAAALHLLSTHGEHGPDEVLRFARAGGYLGSLNNFKKNALKNVVFVPSTYPLSPDACDLALLQRYDGTTFPVTIRQSQDAVPHLLLDDVPLHINSLRCSRHPLRFRPALEASSLGPFDDLMDVIALTLEHDDSASHFARPALGVTGQARSYFTTLTTINGDLVSSYGIAWAYSVVRYASGDFESLATERVTLSHPSAFPSLTTDYHQNHHRIRYTSESI